MTRLRIRASRAMAQTGEFDWALLDAAGRVERRGSSGLEPPPARGACELVIAAEMTTLARVQVPAAQRKRVGGALRFLVEDLVLGEPERVHVAEAAVSPRGALCVGIVERDWLQAVLARLAREGLAPVRAVPETLLAPLDPGEWTVVCDGARSFVRTGAAEGFVLDAAEGEEAPAALRLALQANPPAGIVLYGERNPWELGVPVELRPSWDWAAARSDAPLDFLQGEFSRDAGRARAGWRRTALLAASLAVVALGGLAVQWAAERHERRALAAEMSAIYRETFGAQAVILDPPLQMRRALDGLRQQRGLPSPSDFLALLAKVDPGSRQLESLSYSGKALSLVFKNKERLVLSAEKPPAGPASLPELRARLADMHAMRKEIESLRHKRVAIAPGRGLAQVESRRSAADVDFAEWLDWVRGMQRDFGVRLESAEIRALGTPGRVRVEAAFAMPPE